MPSSKPSVHEALKGALATIEDYLAYRHDGDPWTEDARIMGEMDIDEYGVDGRLEAAKAALSAPALDDSAFHRELLAMHMYEQKNRRMGDYPRPWYSLKPEERAFYRQQTDKVLAEVQLVENTSLAAMRELLSRQSED